MHNDNPDTADMLTRNLRRFAIALIPLITVVGFVSTSAFAENSASPEGKAQTGLSTIMLKAGAQSVRADVANTDATRQIGLMFRKKMNAHEGMLFVFPEVGYHAMWMRNTLIPLSVAYMNEHGVIVSIHEMQALSDVAHQAAGPARYALEMNSGWFSANKVNVGDTIKGIDKAPKPK